MKLISRSEEETEEFGSCLAQKLKRGNIVALSGQLGSGKTRIVKGICSASGVSDIINSPTFILVNEYSSEKFGKIFHFDFYRLKYAEELPEIGFEEYLSYGGLVIIEWPDLARSFLPPDTIQIHIGLNGSNIHERIIVTNKQL
jgi:tRNA threonylcarbamoyladenosine biosynthesis protein TsaE